MTKIILASNSPQRKILLRQAGIRFSTVPSKVKEIPRIKTTCADLVKENARLKAADVASRMNEGLVIGADTLVFDGKSKIIGKPENLKEARTILKRLFSGAHWVYTGVVLIDVSTGRVLTACEKTKVYMNTLSDAEIDEYHRRVSPLDKAGGFDIEGHGALFIRRIEGCYTNVIGLPMARLRKMLKTMGVVVF